MIEIGYRIKIGGQDRIEIASISQETKKHTETKTMTMTEKNIITIAEKIIQDADKRTDSKGEQRLNNASETLGMIGRAISGLDEKKAEMLLPFSAKGKALETMHAFLETFAEGKKEKAPMIPKSEIISENEKLKKELAEFKAKLAKQKA